MSLPIERYLALQDAAAAALVEILADLPSGIAESLVRGVDENDEGPLAPIPAGVWPLAATGDARYDGRGYLLVAVDDDDEWDGAIWVQHSPRYRRVQIRADFILQNWPEHTTTLEPAPIRLVVAQAALRQAVENLFSMTPPDLFPLTQEEAFVIIKQCLPGASRFIVRRHVKLLSSATGPGPRGSRDPLRAERITKLSREFLAAQLHN